MTKETLVEIVESLSGAADDIEADGMEMSDEVAFEIAESVLFDNPGMDKAILKFYGATDAQGWLADRI